MANALMFQGTGSSVGKSVLVAGIARALRHRGFKVLPFKPQNMSNNAAVTADGGEIGRAQALQAMACGVEPSVHMNPVLLKPQSQVGSQIIVQGKIWGQAKAREYQEIKPQLMPYVLESFEILSKQADIVLIEGAGSASEINLRSHDIANMGFAQAVKAPVFLIGDIDRGGVIASLIGTHAVLSSEDLGLVKGFIVNKMRGDPSLFTDVMHWISQKTQWQNMGLLPYFPGLSQLPAEDAADLKSVYHQPQGKLVISVLLLPTISNFDDFDPLKYEENVQLNFVKIGDSIPNNSNVIIIPGSKTTIADLQAIYETGWDIDIKAHVRQGGFVMGICGGYQMLGSQISDPHHIEGDISHINGLNLVNISTQLEHSKTLQKVTGRLFIEDIECSGYEMHLGVTQYHGEYEPFAILNDKQADGIVANNRQVLGTYLHGVFQHDLTRQALLSYFGIKANNVNFLSQVENNLDKWANHIEQHLDVLDLLNYI
ncbi:cobyric acid synthase [Commensalibacter papalotli (ex Botero et al. 2024)]|uniref:Cobyric acid synthase n=1 Tax=Commensalibacter papalotli (ex Botero et al. 2024) TaxID=2972766 RepID=A0ABM9HT27_9PROT|nr:cobyric acid synthase [Commensalibacter papalotli (ex Botero et al. 2024)]CAI3953371.1 Cobyric acid synthase (CobQ) [Commensalibacter papalotli (ex Botero et al. 2024)]CAI3953866.1 Cobyric acid synthase (CobQ) [Commensalibacter papalotli (ex Botero et al. 2024)]